MNKPEASIFVDRDGMYVKHCKDKAQAIKAMREELNSWRDVKHFQERNGNVDDIVLDEETIQETCYRQHRACGVETIGDDDCCYECGEPCGTVGRKCFMIYF